MKQRLYAYYLIVMACLIGIASCQTFTGAQSTQDKLGYAYATIGATYQTIADLANRRLITKEQGLTYIRRTDEASYALGSARAALLADDQIKASAMIDTTLIILTEIERELKEKDKGGQ
jgi:hypothetical protein